MSTGCCAAVSARCRAGRSPGPGPGPTGRGDSGLMTLEWLLIVGAASGLAAFSVLAVQTVVDNASDVPDDPLVRVIEADIAAAAVAAQAQAEWDKAVEAGNLTLYTAALDTGFATRCNPGVAAAYTDVIASAQWFAPDDPNTPNTPEDPADDRPARCSLVPRQNLGQ